MQLVLNSK